MDSLYGGQQGVSFVISNSFKSVSDMVTAFKKGSDYKDVWYNEYCLIDTPNKNDADNGKIYKRGLNYMNSNGGALYLGQIVGPSSGTPYVQVGTLASVDDKSKEALVDNSYMRYPYADASGKYSGITDKPGSTSAKFDLKVDNNGLVPGKTADGKYNDSVRYTWLNIRKDDADADSWFYVGLQIPYSVVDYVTHTNSPYDAQGNRLPEASTISRVDDKTHPYYERWDIGLPHGIKGDTLRRLRVIVPTSNDKIYPYTAFSTNSSNGQTVLDISAGNYPGMDDDVANGRKIIVFDYYVYDNKMNPTPYMVYLGDFDIISNITMADDGTIRIDYTHSDDAVFSKRVKWISNITLTTGNGSSGGMLTVSYNNGAASSVFNMTWIKDIQIDDEGTVTYTYAGTNNGSIPSNGIVTNRHQVKWVKDTSLDIESGHFVMDFNDGSSYSNNLDWVKDIEIEQSSGLIKIYRTTSGEKVLASKLKLVTGASIIDTADASNQSNGNIVFTCNTGESIPLKISGTQTNFQLRYVKNIALNTGILDDKRIQVQYNNGSSYIGNPINSIQNMVINPGNFHLLVLYSDPTHRPNVTSATATYPDGTTSSDWVSNDEVRSFDQSVPSYTTSNVYWRDFGPIKDDHGVLIGFNVDDTMTGGKDILQWLQETYPQGLTTNAAAKNSVSAAIAQKIVTYAPQTGNTGKSFYAYDYMRSNWYYLGTISDTGIRDVKILDKAAVGQDTLASINSKGALLAIDTATVFSNAIPSYWSPEYTGW